ncbi:MAG: hypothetical protein KGI75_12360 [Rhizobiaceae bacterium]|nr:hypothetical protein [Rhizobiaceae bacterium]
MHIELDQTSRATINRFAIKCIVATLIAMLSGPNHLLSAAYCFQLYALLMAAVAVLTRQRYSARSLNHWSEVLWLAFVSAGLQLYAHAIA